MCETTERRSPAANPRPSRRSRLRHQPRRPTHRSRSRSANPAAATGASPHSPRNSALLRVSGRPCARRTEYYRRQLAQQAPQDRYAGTGAASVCGMEVRAEVEAEIKTITSTAQGHAQYADWASDASGLVDYGRRCQLRAAPHRYASQRGREGGRSAGRRS